MFKMFCFNFDSSRPTSSNGILLGSLLIPLAITSTQPTHCNITIITSSSSSPQPTRQMCLAIPSIIFSLACLVCIWFTRCKLSVEILERQVSVRWVASWVVILLALNRLPVSSVAVVILGGVITCKYTQ